MDAPCVSHRNKSLRTRNSPVEEILKQVDPEFGRKLQLLMKTKFLLPSRSHRQVVNLQHQ